MSESILKLKDGYELLPGVKAYFVLRNSLKMCKSLRDLYAHCEEMTSLQNGDSSLIHKKLYGQPIDYDRERYKISIYGTLQGGLLGENRPGAFCEILSFNFYNANNPMLDFKFPHIQESVVTAEFVELVSNLTNSLLKDQMVEASDDKKEKLYQLLKRFAGMTIEDDLVDRVVAGLGKIRGNIANLPELKKTLGKMVELLQAG